jgi:3-methyladenine DNA glycosylase AlkD
MPSKAPPPQAAAAVQGQLLALADPPKAAFLQRFFKTAPGQYGHGDVFLGIKVPVIRQIARAHRDLPLPQAARLLKSPHHEVRLAALIILVLKFEKADASTRQRIYKLYLGNTKRINNWDLVDLSAPNIVGAFLFERPRDILFQLARSKLLWDRRIAIVATHYFIRHNDCATTLAIAELLLDDKEDLIHKAAGWMLREVGKRDLPALEKFLQTHCRRMPRTMLRYAIERFAPGSRSVYLAGGPFSAISPGTNPPLPRPSRRV